jgi:cGMP-dependent protein kinase
VAGQLALSKKQGVSGQSVQSMLPTHTQKHSKDFRTKALIKEAIMDNDFLKNLSSSQVVYPSVLLL